MDLGCLHVLHDLVLYITAYIMFDHVYISQHCVVPYTMIFWQIFITFATRSYSNTDANPFWKLFHQNTFANTDSTERDQHTSTQGNTTIEFIIIPYGCILRYE